MKKRQAKKVLNPRVGGNQRKRKTISQAARATLKRERRMPVGKPETAQQAAAALQRSFAKLSKLLKKEGRQRQKKAKR